MDQGIIPTASHPIFFKKKLMEITYLIQSVFGGLNRGNQHFNFFSTLFDKKILFIQSFIANFNLTISHFFIRLHQLFLKNELIFNV
jgi:hypothetical protein